MRLKGGAIFEVEILRLNSVSSNFAMLGAVPVVVSHVCYIESVLNPIWSLP